MVFWILDIKQKYLNIKPEQILNRFQFWLTFPPVCSRIATRTGESRSTLGLGGTSGPFVFQGNTLRPQPRICPSAERRNFFSMMS